MTLTHVQLFNISRTKILSSRYHAIELSHKLQTLEVNSVELDFTHIDSITHIFWNEFVSHIDKIGIQVVITNMSPHLTKVICD